MAKQITVTDEGLKKLTEELEYLKNTKRKEIGEAIQVARSFGDLSENSEYDEAMNEQAKLEAKITEIEDTLKNIKVIDESEIHTDSVNVGARVKVFIEKYEEEVVYDIVGSTEADPMANKISDHSPIGSALLGKKKGDMATAHTPGGDLNIKIIDITK